MIDFSSYEEKSLFSRMADGDECAFNTIFFHYLPRLQPFLLKMTRSPEATEEIIHDVFLSLWLNRSKNESIENYEAYIFTSVTNKTFTYLKKLSRERERATVIQLPEEENTTEHFINFKESHALIQQAVEQLPPQRKLIFKLSREEGLSHDEISRQLRISKNTVKNQMVQALRFIKDYLHNSSALPLVLLVGHEVFARLSP